MEIILGLMANRTAVFVGAKRVSLRPRRGLPRSVLSKFIYRTKLGSFDG